jgi:plastocyanin
MFHKFFLGLATIAASAGMPACAATVNIAVTDSDGAPAANAVVSLASEENNGAVAAHTPEKGIIDQRHETFLPLVVVVRRGGEVVFTNNDVTMHQVYSFSPIRQFQFEIDKGQISRPVVFDRPGVAAIGCNIHDNMVAYVYVADAPFAAVTDAHGHAEIQNVPEGQYLARVWHPQLRVGHTPLPNVLTVGNESAKLSMSVPLMAMPAMSRMHKSDY